eukprot:COSAG02_NODE_2442_length_8854_cov_2.621359_10_plen_68_part_00
MDLPELPDRRREFMETGRRERKTPHEENAAGGKTQSGLEGRAAVQQAGRPEGGGAAGAKAAFGRTGR